MSKPRLKVVPPQRDPKILGRKTSATTRPGESRQDLRTAATREALLAAACKIFVRDGFEASRIEDIAAEAGRSRGAFYVNFSNKAEAFLLCANNRSWPLKPDCESSCTVKQHAKSSARP